MDDALGAAPVNDLVRDVARTVRTWPVFTAYVGATLVAAVIVGLITINVIDLGMQHFGDPAHRTHDVAFGALFTTLVLGIAVQLRRPSRNVAGMCMALLPPACLLLTGVLVDDVDRVFEFNPLRYAAAIAGVTVLVHPAGRAMLRSIRIGGIAWPLAGLTAVLAVPLIRFASTNLRLQQDVPDAHGFMGHYGFMAALAYTIIGVGTLACLRQPGWRLPACCAALLAATLGATSLLYPDAASSLDPGWALLSISWAVAFVVTAIRTDGTVAAPPQDDSTPPKPEPVGRPQ